MKSRTGLLLTALCVPAIAEDWPEWRGKGRAGVWTESGILDRFSDNGLAVAWRTPVRGGFAGPAVAAGRVFVTDFQRSGGMKGTERVLCLEVKSGKVLWTREWAVDYQGVSYASGPRATPTIDGDRVYVVGATGVLLCLNTGTGDVIWWKDYVKDYQLQMPIWGIASAPIVDGDRLIAVVGGQPDAKVVAFDKLTGREIWRALASDSELGYSQPVIVEVGGVRQLIYWHPAAVVSLDPASGKVHWQQPFKVNLGVTLSTPVLSGSRLLVSSFYNGSMLLDLAGRKPAYSGKARATARSIVPTANPICDIHDVLPHARNPTVACPQRSPRICMLTPARGRAAFSGINGSEWDCSGAGNAPRRPQSSGGAPFVPMMKPANLRYRDNGSAFWRLHGPRFRRVLDK